MSVLLQVALGYILTPSLLQEVVLGVHVALIFFNPGSSGPVNCFLRMFLCSIGGLVCPLCSSARTCSAVSATAVEIYYHSYSVAKLFRPNERGKSKSNSHLFCNELNVLQ